MMLVRELTKREKRDRAQCSVAIENMSDASNLPWRHKNHHNLPDATSDQCLRLARYEVDGRLYCSQHAGMRAIEYLIESSHTRRL